MRSLVARFSNTPRHRATASLLAATLAAAVAMIAAAGLFTASGSARSLRAARLAKHATPASTNKLGTITPGVMKVAIESYMPYTGLKNGKIDGLDGDIINYVAKKLGLKVQPVLTDFTGMLGDVQSHRVDITVGGVAWSATRAKAGIFTDPPYYSPPAMAVQGGKVYKTVQSLEGLNIGTVTGYVWVNSIKQIPRATLHAYPSATSVFSDLSAGRINIGFLDPLLILYYQHQNASSGVKGEYLTPPSAAEVKAHPAWQYFQPYMTGYYLPKQESTLEQAVSKQIDDMYKNGKLKTLIKKWGGNPSQFLVPSAGMAGQRHSVDRPKSWKPPTIG